ncbi:tripartite tricarboxylate transporter TctB family protein [Hoeflea halophila]|uniref:Tripartite tricarboxylate transporter TctB family protein n=1 Tax=Hoeflea halophila TaxID=714899 RepID=A0A286IAP9_9HYPH|nr:tripartite tricarboxylate transporter TctB family protein [Hoeflea halophila]SOE17195.1 tripartite tricarboxylate transporter TctB family protein [Hoeflea halophila]
MSGQSTRRPGELAFICLLTLFSAAALWQAYGISGFSGLSQPGVFPMLAAATMLASCLFILASTLRTRSSREPGESVVFWRDVLPVRLLVILAMVALYLYAMPWLGFVIASGLFLFASFAYLWRKNALISLALSAGSLAAVYFLFRIVFEVVLPQGKLLPAGVF